jgi:hypothetical protein
MKKKIRSIIREVLKEEIQPINKGSKTSTRLVEIDYGGKKMKAVAIGFASGTFFREVYYLIDEVQYENSDFNEVKEIKGSDLLLRK